MKGRFLHIALLLCAIVAGATTIVCAQNGGGREIDVKIYFSYDQTHIDPTYMANHTTLLVIDSLLRDSQYLATLSNIRVSVQSSPEGSVSYNRRLSERRCRVLEEYFAQNYPHVDAELWSFEAVAENWAEFRLHLAEDAELPNREQVLSIVDGEREPDAKEWLLKKMNHGETWQYIRQHILPQQRFGASVIFVPLVHVPLAQQPEFAQSAPPQMSMPGYTPPPSEELLVAVKSNLVLDLLTVVNIAAEVPIGEHWSVVGEVAYPWWRSWRANYTMQIESYHAEVKYWLGDRTMREQLEGWSVSAYGGWGRYDIQPFTKRGVQGEFSDFGLELGYSHPIARNLNLEYTVGLGYVSTRYEDYRMVRNTDKYGDIKVIPYPWMKNSVRTLLPTRCGVSLVWLIRTKRGGGR